MPQPSERSGRHRKPEPQTTNTRKLGRVIAAYTIFVLLVGTIFVGGYLTVWALLSNDNPLPTGLRSVSPETVSTPDKPSIALSEVNIDKDCKDFFDRDDAQKYFIAQGGPQNDTDDLDMDNDGLACENYDYSSTDPGVPPSTRGVQSPKFYGTDNSKVNQK